MDTIPFIVHSQLGKAEIRPCCRENNVVDYAVWLDNKLAFTVAKDLEQHERWVVALKNADDIIGDQLVQEIGNQIAAHYGQNN